MTAKEFSNFFNEKQIDPFPILGDTFLKYIAIDLSQNNEKLQDVDVSSAEKLGEFISNQIKINQAQIAFGGYLEVRTIYKRSGYFNNEIELERNIHLGIDLWCEADIPVYAPLNGIVHSFKNNTNFGDYGPTIIMKHNIYGVEFYTLYGHLSLESIEHLKVGKCFEKGAKIGTLGTGLVNGDYPPHLHFQLIKDISGYIGDYPGVCNKSNLEFFKVNCPNPQFLSGIVYRTGQ